MTQPLISIIVPIYNAEKTINRCIDSILAQTYSHFELLLINDGSKDKSGEICDKYASTDTRIKVFHQENKGVSAARNKGIDNANGEYITFIDSDDYVDYTFLEDFEINTIHNYDIIAQGAKSINNNKIQYCKYSYTRECTQSEFATDSFNNYLIMPCWAKLIKLTIVQENNLHFNVNYSNHEDFIFVKDYIKLCTSFKTIHKTCYNYTHENPESLSSPNKSGVTMYHLMLLNYKILTEIKITINISEQIFHREVRRTILNIYAAIISIIKDNTQKYKNKILFLQNIDDSILHESKNIELPTFYKIMFILYRLLPAPLYILSIQFLIKIKNL